MIFVTVGTEQYPFNALMTWIDLLGRYNVFQEEVVIQYGASTFVPDGARVYKLLPEPEFKALTESARVIVGHCGEGTALLLETCDKPYVLVPRTHRFGEHVDDHQMEMADAFEQQGIPIARSPGDLAKFFKLLQTPEAVQVAGDESELCAFLRNFWEERSAQRGASPKLMLVCSSGGHFKYMQSLQPFWQACADRVWVTFRTATTLAELQNERAWWAHFPTNRNLPNLLRNLVMSWRVLQQERPQVVVSTGAGVAVPFLLAAKWWCGSQIVFVESKTRLKDLSLSARLLQRFQAIDLLVVRSAAIRDRYPQATYIPVGQSDEGGTPRDFKQGTVTSFDDVVLIGAPPRLGFLEARGFRSDFLTLCNADDPYRKIVIDLSATNFIDSAGVGALIDCLKNASLVGSELVLWSVGREVASVFALTSLTNVFAMEPAAQTFRVTGTPAIGSVPAVKCSLFAEFLFRLQAFLHGNALLRPLYWFLKFFYPAIDIDPHLELHPSVRDPLKRLLDIVGGLVGLTFTGLIFIPIAIAIARESEGPILFGQIRCGLLGKPFRIWKFRSMVKNAEALRVKVQNQIQAGTQSTLASGDKFFKNENDPRVTRIGKLLRKTSLDEFPQFWNVLTGDMSLVGTRPPTFQEIGSYELEMEYQSEKFTEWNRLDVKPGITGQWQVSGRSSVRSFAEVVNFDLEYRKDWSITRDLDLIVKTVLVLLDRKNKAV